MTIKISYSAWKTIVQTNNLPVYFLRISENIRLSYAGISGKIYEAHILEEDFSDWDSVFESSDWETTEVFNKNDPEALISGIEPNQTTSVPFAKSLRGEAIVHAELPIGGGYRPTTHNFCDPCTWYQKSEHLPGATTSTSDDLTFQILDTDTNPVEYVIDIRHSRLVDENSISNNYVTNSGVTMSDIIPTVFVDGTPLDNNLEVDTEAELAEPIDADSYWINYEQGQIVFKTSKSGNTITINCRRKGTEPGSSSYEFKPVTGYEYLFEDAEVDYTGNFNMTSAMEVIVWVSNSTLTDAAFLDGMGVPGMDMLTGTQIIPAKLLDPAENRFYKTFHDFQSKARAFYGPLPAGHGGTTRGSNSDKYTFRWEYAFRDMLEPENRAGYAEILTGDPMAMTLHNIELVLEDDIPWESLDEHPSIFTMTFIGRKRKISS
jgi:hypothetical protein